MDPLLLWLNERELPGGGRECADNPRYMALLFAVACRGVHQPPLPASFLQVPASNVEGLFHTQDCALLRPLIQKFTVAYNQACSLLCGTGSIALRDVVHLTLEGPTFATASSGCFGNRSSRLKHSLQA